MGLFSVCDYKCSECTYLDLSKREYGKYFCEKEYDYIRANELSCHNFCRAYSRDSGEIRRAEEFSENYNRESSHCYITTMVCNIMQQRDYCYCLKVLRKFREDVLRKSTEGIELLIEYDVVGPEIASNLEKDNARLSISTTLFNNFIVPTVQCIENKCYGDAIVLYKGMTERLMNFYHINYIKPDNINDIDVAKCGHGGLVYKKHKKS